MQFVYCIVEPLCNVYKFLLNVSLTATAIKIQQIFMIKQLFKAI